MPFHHHFRLILTDWRLTSSPKGVDSTNQRLCMADVVNACFQNYDNPQKMVNLYKSSIFVISETQFAIQTQVT